MVIFNSYVKLPEGNMTYQSQKDADISAALVAWTRPVDGRGESWRFSLFWGGMGGLLGGFGGGCWGGGSNVLFCAFHFCACIWMRLHMCITPLALSAVLRILLRSDRVCCYVTSCHFLFLLRRCRRVAVTPRALHVATLSWGLLLRHLLFLLSSRCCYLLIAKKKVMMHGVWPKDTKIRQKFWRTSPVRNGEEYAQQRALTWSSNNSNHEKMKWSGISSVKFPDWKEKTHFTAVFHDRFVPEDGLKTPWPWPFNFAWRFTGTDMDRQCFREASISPFSSSPHNRCCLTRHFVNTWVHSTARAWNTKSWNLRHTKRAQRIMVSHTFELGGWERTMPLEPRLMPTFAPSARAFRMPACRVERQ